MPSPFASKKVHVQPENANKSNKTKKFSISAAVTKHLYEADAKVREYLMSQEFMQHVETVSATQPVPPSLSSKEPPERLKFRSKMLQKSVMVDKIFNYLHAPQTERSSAKPDYFPEHLFELRSLRFGLWKPLDTTVTNEEIMIQTGINLLVAHFEEGERHWVVHKKSDEIALMSVPHHSRVLPSSTPLSHLKPRSSKRPSRKPFQACCQILLNKIDRELHEAATAWRLQDQKQQDIAAAHALALKYPAPGVCTPNMTEGKTNASDLAEKENANNAIDTNLAQVAPMPPSSNDQDNSNSHALPLRPPTETGSTNDAKTNQIDLAEGANTEGKTNALDLAEKENANNAVDTNVTQVAPMPPSSNDQDNNNSHALPLRSPAPYTETGSTNDAKTNQIDLAEGANTMDQEVASAPVNTDLRPLSNDDKDVAQTSSPLKRRSPNAEMNCNFTETADWNPENKRIRRGSE